MAKPTYWELLKDPRWQRKRLEVMERDGFACVYCDSAEKTLNVHHSYYERGNAPWEYPDSSLHTLCEDCHKIAQESLTQLHREIGHLSLGDIDILCGVALGLQLQADPDVLVEVRDGQVAEGIGAVFHVNGGAIVRAMNSRNRISGKTAWAISDQVRSKTYDGSLKEPEET
jgi:hypothetical protein